MSTADREVREWKIWRDGSDQAVMGEDTYGEDVVVIERKAYDSLKAELDEANQVAEANKKISLTHQQKTIDAQAENERLRSELATANEFRAKWQKAFKDSEARAEKLVDALKFYSDRKKWDEILMLEGAVFGNCEGDPAIVFDAEDDSPWEVAKNALAEWEKK